MITRNGVILLEYVELVNDQALTIHSYKKAIHDRRITVVQRGSAGRPALIDWASLPEKYKELVRASLGDPEQLAKSQTVESHLQPVQEDDNYIDGFQSGNGLSLPVERRAELKNAARIMAFLATIDAVMKEGGSPRVQQHFGMPVMALKEAILGYVKANKKRLPSKFPTSYARLEARKRAYLKARSDGEVGAASLIHGGHGNSNSDKVSTEEQRKALRLVAARPQNYGLRTIAKHYNIIAHQRGWPTISANTVKRFLATGDNGRTVTLYAKGASAYQNKYGVVVHRSRPTQPTYLWVHDATVYELLYQKEVGGKRTYHHRKKVVVVVDPHTWYPVGFAIGDEDNIELSQAAMRDAVRHMRDLVGTYALPYQVQSDRLGHKTLKAWYEGMGVKYTPAAARNARAKIVEPWFRQHNDHYVNRNMNWSGHNITASVHNQPNPDALNINRKSFPTEAGVIEQITECINRERADKAEAYRDAVNAMPEGALRRYNRVQFLEQFGTVHQWTNELTNQGICPTLLGEERVYMQLDKIFLDHIGTSFQVTFDPEDLSDVLATAREGSIRFLLPEVQKVPMALMDHTPETRAQLAAIENFKSDLSKEAIHQVLNDHDQLHELSEALLQDALLRLKKKNSRVNKVDDLVTSMSPEEEVVTKAYLTEGGSHKAALQTAQTEAERRAAIERRAEEQL